MTGYFVYALFRPDNGQVFYIGAAVRKNRVYDHFGKVVSGHGKVRRTVNAFNELGYKDIPWVVIKDNLSFREAASLETLFIDTIGRSPNGPLVNVLRIGGIASETTRSKMSASAKVKERDPEVEARRTARMADPDVRAKMRAAKLGKPSAKLGRKFPSEAVRLVQSKLGWITDGSTETRVNKTAPIPHGWRRGRLKTVSTEELQKRATVQQEKREAWLYRNRDAFWITNGTGNRKIRTGTDIPSGWRKGKSNKPQSNLVW
jgi:hypothetical protein